MESLRVKEFERERQSDIYRVTKRDKVIERERERESTKESEKVIERQSD